mmetsp:Transcript_2134/g.4322  ORF Transcript_2134/g.4322 Transcript_2134/m.4322 type:complete len:534 (-) Transcript_2134:105-1706(-)
MSSLTMSSAASFHQTSIRSGQQTETRSSSSSSSSLLYHDASSPHLILRPTAPSIAWKRLKGQHFGTANDTAPVEELSLIGWSYQNVMGKLHPIWSDVTTLDEPQEASDDRQRRSEYSLRALHVVSTDMWVSSQLRSPFTLGVDSTTASLLSTSFCQNLSTLTISRSCNKSRQDWIAFSQAVSSLPCLSRLELCDASDYYTGTTALANEEVDVSVLLDGLSTLADEKRPLETLKLQFNAYQPGKLSLESWVKFWAKYHDTLKELSLHMTRIEGNSKRTTIVNNDLLIQKDLPMETLQLMFVDFDSHETWSKFFLGCMFGYSERNQNYNNEMAQSQLQTLVLVNPSWTSKQYHALWTRLFHPTASNQNEFSRLQTLSTSVWTAYSVLGLRKPSPTSTSRASDLCRVKRSIQMEMQPSISHLLSGWREHPPSTNLQQFLFPHDGEHDVKEDEECSKRSIDHDSWHTLVEIWNLYRFITNLQQDDCESLTKARFHEPESVLDLLCRQLHRKDSAGNFPSLDCVYHFMSFFGPTTLCS